MLDFAENIEETTLDLEAISEFLMLTERRVQQLAAMGIVKRAARGRYYLKLSVQGYINYLQQTRQSGEGGEGEENEAALFEKAKARREMAKAEKAEMELAALRMELVPASEVASTWNKITEILKKRLLSLPTELAPLMVPIKSTQEGHALVMKHVKQMMQELAETDVILRTDGSSDSSEAG